MLKKLNFILVGSVLAGLAGAADQRPNLLVLLSDDQRVDTLGCYQPDRPLPTPNIDKLAADGIRFTNGFVTTPICAVSRACIMTGRYSSSTGMTNFRSVIDGDVLENSYNMLARLLGTFVNATVEKVDVNSIEGVRVTVATYLYPVTIQTDRHHCFASSTTLLHKRVIAVLWRVDERRC